MTTQSRRAARRMARPARLVCACLVAVCALAHAQPALARDFLWRVSARGAVVYLVGSVHLLSADYYPLSLALEQAYKDADLLVEEVDLGEMLMPQAQLQMLTRGMLPANQSLDTVVSPATLALVTKHVAGIGMPIEPLKRFKPWMLALTLEGLEWQKAGFDPDLGLDKHFYDRAQTDRKTVQGLETTEFQIAMLDGMPMTQQEKLLAQTLKEIDTEMASITRLANAWRAGDVPAIEAVVLKDVRADPQTYQRLLVDRNRIWLPKVEALFSRSGRALVVVGAAHLVGPDGLIAMLKAKGYSVEQL